MPTTLATTAGRLTTAAYALTIGAFTAAALAIASPAAAATPPSPTVVDLHAQGSAVSGSTGAMMFLLAVILTALFHGTSKGKKQAGDK